jgi:hypothetical protein
MGFHWVSIIPVHVSPYPNPRPYDKPTVLPGLWLEHINGEFGAIAQKRPPDRTIRDMTEAVVLDYPVYVKGLLERLKTREPETIKLLEELERENESEDRSDLYAEHPLEIYLLEEDIRKLVMMSCILADAEVFVLDRPVLARVESREGIPAPEFDRWENDRHVWQWPSRPDDWMPAGPQDIPVHKRLEMQRVRFYCELLEPYFRAKYWHSGRVAVALGAFLSYALGPDTGQGYLALMTVFEAILSTEKTEITHQISERLAFMLETDEDARYALYKRMKRLYNTRSRLVHGDIENKKGLITYDRLRLDAKMTIVPDQDYADIFDLCIRLFRRVLSDPPLLALLEKKHSSTQLAEHYLRLGFRG